MIGTIKTLSNKGYFFCEVPDLGDVFVTAMVLPAGQRNLDGLDIGMQIEISDVERTDKGYRAVSAKLVGRAPELPKPTQTTNLSGNISRLRPDRGFGFIRIDPYGEYFFHAGDVTGNIRYDDMNEGDPVFFDIAEDVRKKGPRACNVQVVV